MPPDDKLDIVRARMDPNALAILAQSPPIASTPAPSDPETDGLAFENEAYRYAADWLETHADDALTAKPFALVFSRSIAQDEAMLSAATFVGKNYEAFKHQKGNEVTGCLVFATMNFEQALVVPIAQVVDSQSLFDAISHCACNDRVVAVLEPAHANFIIRRSGGATRSVIVKKPGQGTLWKLAQLEAEIMTFHNDFTRTPSGILMPWISAADGITVDRLENRISKNLAYVLDTNFTKGSVIAEAETSSGRMDIYLVPNVLEPGAAVIEVKVLRSHQGQKKKPVKPEFNVWWGRKGAVQADLYRNDKHASNAYLCCFDAREQDVDIPEVEGEANARNVKSRRYFMYRSAADLQAAELAKAASISGVASGG
jgi:hypothetical protein